MRAKVCARAGDAKFFLFTLKAQKAASLPCSVTVTYPFLPCVRALALGTSFILPVWRRPKCGWKAEEGSGGDLGRGGSRSGVSVVALPGSALQTAQRLTGAARPSRVKVESGRETARRG